MNAFLPGQLTLGDGAALIIVSDDSTAEVSLGTECFEVLQLVNAKRRLTRPTGAIHQTTKRVFEFEIVAHGV